MERLALPAIRAFRPDAIVVACGFDASAVDPLGRMLLSADSFREMTRSTMALAQTVCGGRLVLVHEGGYSEVHVPFCGHAVLEELSGSRITAPDPLGETIALRQPSAAAETFVAGQIAEMVAALRA
jgi:acetoin utilization deacetylase AcuC-like enzyme